MVTIPLYVLVSVCGCLYTVMDSVPSASGLAMVSKKGMDPSSLLSSTVNFMAGSTLLMCLEEALFVDFLVDDKGIIHKPAPEPRGVWSSA